MHYILLSIAMNKITKHVSGMVWCTHSAYETTPDTQEHIFFIYCISTKKFLHMTQSDIMQ